MRPSNSTIQMRHLASFVVTAEELHFTHAAARLHIAQQTLSQQIRQLEDSLGVLLLDRTTRKVELTDAGAVFFKRCVEMLETFEAAYAEAHRAATGDVGSLRLAFTPSFSGMAAEMRTRILEEQPGLRVSLVQCWTEQALSGTLDRTYQAALIHSEHEHSGLVSRRAGAAAIGVVLGAGDPLAETDAVGRDELLLRTLAVWPRELSPQMFALMEDLFREHFERGDYYEFETMGGGLFLDDERASGMIAGNRAFTPAVQSAVRPTDPVFVWRAISPPAVLPAQLVYREEAAPGGAELDAILRAATALWGAPAD